jgi:hypothetical protein
LLRIVTDFCNGSAKETTVTMLNKEGNSYKGMHVFFIGALKNFVQVPDGSAATVSDPNAVFDSNASGVIAIEFPTGTDLEKVNTGDTLAVWGIDAGTVSETNTLKVSIQEVIVTAVYITDDTTGYATH